MGLLGITIGSNYYWSLPLYVSSNETLGIYGFAYSKSNYAELG
jgi:hypothetical protein